MSFNSRTSMKAPQTPFTILALAPIGEVKDNASSAEIIEVDRDSLDEAVKELATTLSIPVPKDLCSTGFLSFKPSGIKDFKPQAVVKSIPYLKGLSDAVKFIEQAVTEGVSIEHIARRLRDNWPELPVDLTIPTSEFRTQKQEESAVDDIFSMVAMPGGTDTGARGRGGSPVVWRGKIDALQSQLLEKIFADERFRSMEAAWHGIETIVRQGPVTYGKDILLKVSPVSRDTLSAVLDHLTARLVEDLPNVILIDVSFDTSSPGIQLLKKVADFASTLLVPTVVWLGPRFFHLDNWSELKRLPYLKHHLEDMAYAKWRKLKEQPGSDWLAMAANRFLVREPYGDSNPPRTVFFTENEPLWISPVWALGALVAKSMTTFGWPTRFTDYQVITLKDLALSFTGSPVEASTETVFPEDRIHQFIECGITSLSGAAGKDQAFIPLEATVSGGSLGSQLFFNRIVTYLFLLRDRMGEPANGETLNLKLKASLSQWFRDTGHEPPADLAIDTDQTKAGKPLSIRVSFTPPKTVHPLSQRLEFDFQW